MKQILRFLIFAAVTVTGFGIEAKATQASETGASNGEARFLSRVRQLTFDGRRSGEGYFAPDAQALIFQSEREPGNPFYQIYTLDLRTGESRRVSPGVGKTTCAFFRPGTDEVLFGSTHHDPQAEAKQKSELEFRASGKERRYAWDYDPQMDIYSAKQDGSGLTRLTEAVGYDAEGAYSPDGRQIVFCSLRHAYPTNQLSSEQSKQLEVDPAYFGEIYLMNADGSNVRRLTRTPGYDGGPFFSPDGKRIVWRRFEENGAVAEVYTMNLDGSDVRQLTESNVMSWAPYFHPSGEYIIYSSNQEGFSNFELYLVDAKGERQPVRVTHTEGFDGLPVFSPEGNRLCWTSTRTADEKSQLFLAQWNHEAAQAALNQAPTRTTPKEAPSFHAGSQRGHEAPSFSFEPAITEEDLRSQVEYLASDKLEGRLSGTSGARQAAAFIADQLSKAGLEPAESLGSFLQPFEFSSGVRVIPEENRLQVRVNGEAADEPTYSFEVEENFRPLSFTANDEVEGEVLFAGYGLSVPGKEGEGYNSYAGVDATNKIVLVLRYVPEGVTPERRADLNRYAGLRYKAMIARENGAKAILFVTGPNSPNAGELAPLSFDASMSGSGIVAASITGDVAETLLKPGGRDLKTLQSALDKENPHAESGMVLPKVQLKLATGVERIQKTGRNVVGILPAPASGDAAEYVLLGAHYDHLGHGESGSRQNKGESGRVHNGADDNASGVAAVMEVAAALAKERRENPDQFRRGLIFAFWSAEELGVIGSAHFADEPVVDLSQITAYLNFDMVGRMRDNRLMLQGTGSSSVWAGLIEKRNVAAGFDLSLQEDPYLPTDVISFYPKQVPVLSFFTGSHDDYHRPTDDADKINYEGLNRIAGFAEGLTLDLVQSEKRPDYQKVERTHSGSGARETLRVYLGTIPDYTTEVDGVKLSGVRAGGPANKAGLQGGDVIVEFGGQKIANIYDYTYALDAATIGEPIKVVVQRGDEQVTLEVVPEARE